MSVRNDTYFPSRRPVGSSSVRVAAAGQRLVHLYLTLTLTLLVTAGLRPNISPVFSTPIVPIFDPEGDVGKNTNGRPGAAVAVFGPRLSRVVPRSPPPVPSGPPQCQTR